MDQILSSLDLLILVISGVNFMLFLAVHVITLRCGKFRSASTVIGASFTLGLVGCVLGSLWEGMIHGNVKYSGLGIFVFTSVIASILYGFFVFHYIAWFFGMGEAAIRIHLLDEVDRRRKNGISLEEIYNHYNAETIMQIRLTRLLNAGHLSFDGKVYRVKNPILLLQAFLLQQLKRLLKVKCTS